jgi:predicted RecB family nuclease
MWKDGNDYRFSPSDLIRFFESSYITWMDRYLLDCPNDVQADQDSDEIELIRQKGWEHEREFLAELRHAGKEVTDLGEGEGRSRRTVDAMQRGADVIYQGCLELHPFQGYPDFLVRVDYPSALGTWSYEVWDTKLARHPKPYFLIQLCAYAEMLEAVQGVGPREVRVVLGRKAPDAKIVPFRTEEFLYYFRVLKQAFLEQQRHFDRSEWPDIPVMTDLGRWTGHATRQLVALDDLSLVADIRRSQIRKLRSAGISTVAALGACDGVEIPKLAPAVFSRLRQQARLQIESRGRPRPNFLVLPQEQDIQQLGVRALPPPSEGDVFFDMEGFPLVDDGREYLFGTCYWHDGSLKFRDWWAHSVSEERAAFADFVRWLCERRKQYPDLHLYHYASYEVTALRRLMGRHGICESEVDGLLRGEVFVDLYRIVRQSLLIGQPSYSLKDVEQLYRPKREGEVANAGASMVMYQRWIMEPEGGSPATSSLLESIRVYNEDDCRSTAELAHWLRTLPAADDSASKVGENAQEIEEEEFAASEDLQRRAGLARSLLDEVPADWETRDDRERWRIQQLLAHLLEFHRREQKPSWWKRFDRQKMDEGELFNDAECLAGLERTEKRAMSIKQSSVYQFRFNPHQETKVREGDQCLFAHDWRLKATVVSLDFDNGLSELKISNRQGPPPRRLSLAPEDLLVGKHLDAAVERLVTKWRSSDRLPTALEDFLYRRRPRLRGYSGGPILKDGIDSVQGAADAAMALDNSTLSIQGPPGTGKTYTAARMAAACLAGGYRVGVT